MTGELLQQNKRCNLDRPIAAGAHGSALDDGVGLAGLIRDIPAGGNILFGEYRHQYLAMFTVTVVLHEDAAVRGLKTVGIGNLFTVVDHHFTVPRFAVVI